jgi:hypothetical protein
MNVRADYIVRKYGRFLPLLLIAFLILPHSSLSQDENIPRFRIETYSTLYEVRVMDSDGRVVSGLSKKDFQILENGKPCVLRYFEERRDTAVSIAILLDIGSSMNSEQIRAAKEAISELIHLLDPEDEILIAVYDDDFHSLSELTTDRLKLNKSIANISPGARASFFARMASGFGTSAHTGYAVDMASLELRNADYANRVVLVFSAAFGNIGVATEEHLSALDTRLFGVKWPNKLGDAFNLWGDWSARSGVLKKSGGIQFSGKTIADKLNTLAETIKSFYLIAYTPAGEDDSDIPDVEIQVVGNPNYQVFASRKAPAAR